MSLILFSNVLTTWDSGTVVVKLLFYLIICCHMCLGQCGTHSWDTWDRRGFANRPKCLCGSMGADRVVSQRKCLSLLYWCSIVKTGYRSHHAFGRAFCLTGGAGAYRVARNFRIAEGRNAQFYYSGACNRKKARRRGWLGHPRCRRCAQGLLGPFFIVQDDR
jgi:hypothetical protein